jgi:hypothetical protein
LSPSSFFSFHFRPFVHLVPAVMTIPWQFVVQGNMTETQMQFYDCAVISTIDEFVRNHHYPLFESVLRQFLIKFGAPSLQHLGLSQLPSLDLLYDTQQKCNAFISAYVGTQSVVSFSDLELELCVMLRSFNIPIRKSPPPPLDPNEVNIDMNEQDEEEEEKGEHGNAVSSSFEVFGLGPLALHPQVQQLFPGLAAASVSVSVSTADVISRLEEFLSSPTHCSSSSSNTSTGFNSEHTHLGGRAKVRIDISNFQAYVCQYYEVSSPGTLGLLIKGSLEAELLMLRHVTAQREALLLGMQKQYFEGMHEQYASEIGAQSSHDTARKVPKAKPRAASDAPMKLDICPSSRPETLSLLSRFAKKLDCPYAPSFGKAHGVLETLWKQEKLNKLKSLKDFEPHGGSGSGSGSSQSKRRRKRGRSSQEVSSGAVWSGKDSGLGAELLSVFEKELLCCTTEYVMLHVGGSKYKNKHLCALQCGEAVDSEETEEEEEEGVDDNSSNESSGDGSGGGSDSDSSSGEEESSDDDSESEVESDENNCDKDTTSTQVVSTTTPQTTQLNATNLIISSGANSTMPPTHLRSVEPFEGKLMMGSLRASPAAVEAIEVASFLPWCQHNSLSARHASKTEHLRAIGRWGESLVYQYLLFQYPDSKVTWLNEKEETNASYDLKLERKGNSSHHNSSIINMKSNHSCPSGGPQRQIGAKTIFIEVKATQYSDKNVFQISKWEWDFMSSLPRVQYDIYRVYNAGDGQKVKLTVYRDVFKLVEERKIQLCLAV